MTRDLIGQLDKIMPTALTGSVVQTVGMTAAVAGLPAPVGALVEIERQMATPLPAEVVGFRDQFTIVYPLGDLSGIRHGSRVRLVQTSRSVGVGRSTKKRSSKRPRRSSSGAGRPRRWRWPPRRRATASPPAR